MNDFAKLVFAAVLGSVFSGGILFRLFQGALDSRIRTVAEKVAVDEVNKIGNRINGLDTVAHMALEQADHANERIAILEERDNQRWERITERLAETVVRPLERVVERMEEMGRRQERHQADIENLNRRLDERARGGNRA